MLIVPWPTSAARNQLGRHLARNPDRNPYESSCYNPQSEYHNAAVCVFAERNESGKVVFAALRGIDTDLKMDKVDSDKRFNFHIPAKSPDSRHLAIFE